jgi:hypothetical protein
VLSYFATILNHFVIVQSHSVISFVILRILLSHSLNFAQSFLRFVYSAHSFFLFPQSFCDFLSHFMISSIIL